MAAQRVERSPRLLPPRRRADRTKAADARRAPLRIDIEHVREGYDEPEVFDLALSARPAIPLSRVVFRSELRPRDLAPVLADVALGFVLVLINHRQLDRRRHHLRPKAARRAWACG